MVVAVGIDLCRQLCGLGGAILCGKRIFRWSVERCDSRAKFHFCDRYEVVARWQAPLRRSAHFERQVHLESAIGISSSLRAGERGVAIRWNKMDQRVGDWLTSKGYHARDWVSHRAG